MSCGATFTPPDAVLAMARFEGACRQVAQDAAAATATGGIGTLGERTLHAVLKYCWESDATCHEVPVGRYVADIRTAQGIVEIQTRSMAPLGPKLSFFLQQETLPVMLVYPIAAAKWLVWVDPATGACNARNKSPRRGRPSDVLPELYHIRALLGAPGLRLRLPLLELEDYRLQNGWGRDGKRGSVRQERMPLALSEVVALDDTAALASLLPDTLPPTFTTKELATALSLGPKAAWYAVQALVAAGAARSAGKRGRAYLYTWKEPIE